MQCSIVNQRELLASLGRKTHLNLSDKISAKDTGATILTEYMLVKIWTALCLGTEQKVRASGRKIYPTFLQQIAQVCR